MTHETDYYHVAPEAWKDGDPLFSLYRQMGEDAYEEFVRRWPELGAEVAHYHAHWVFLYETLEEAIEHIHLYGGGFVLRIDGESVDVQMDYVEGFPYVQDEIPGNAIQRTREDYSQPTERA